MINITFYIEDDAYNSHTFVFSAEPEKSLSYLIQQALYHIKSQTSIADWLLLDQQQNILEHHLLLSSLLLPKQTDITLILRHKNYIFPPESEKLIKIKKAVKRVKQRIATVRYYNRMNPERVYPLLIMLTKQEVEQIVKKHTSQKSTGPLQIQKEKLLEIEPIIPGCVCYPSKRVAKLSDEDMVFKFHIVPHVVGKVTGAVVSISQDHKPLAEVELEINVVKRTLMVISAIATFLLPFFSTMLEYFKLDFTSQMENDFSVYISLAQLLFHYVSPVVLTLLLAIMTTIFYWITRPKSKDLFYEIKPAH